MPNKNLNTKRSSQEIECNFSTPIKFRKVQWDTPNTKKIKKKSNDSGECQSENECEISSISVIVRVKPIKPDDETASDQPKLRNLVKYVDNENIEIFKSNTKNIQFKFDQIFCSDINNESHQHSLQFRNKDQDYVYNFITKPMHQHIIDGFNTCLLAYGQTGSGKTYSIIGEDSIDGIIPKFCKDIFTKFDTTDPNIKYKFEISFYEIYNEKIKDFLADKTTKTIKMLKVREHPILGPFVENLTVKEVKSYSDIKPCINIGVKERSTASTMMNQRSSRSHCIFNKKVLIANLLRYLSLIYHIDGEIHQLSTTSRANFVDLAGSERLTNVSSDSIHIKESTSINKALHYLGKVIMALSERNICDKNSHIPYRNSILTWILKDSLGGNSKTAMLATISSDIKNFEETLNTLRYATKASSIVNLARVNKDPKESLISQLTEEITKLREMSTNFPNDISDKLKKDINILKDKLTEMDNLNFKIEKINTDYKEKFKNLEDEKINNHHLKSQINIRDKQILNLEKELMTLKMKSHTKVDSKEHTKYQLDQKIDDKFTNYNKSIENSLNNLTKHVQKMSESQYVMKKMDNILKFI
ncbi:hypothetical protein A3Q56_01115 [Intoshia linei]|uniref:Kinesin motor domain-containing protein n=1 Tax=Intoshia linei TaxID=1819745 RepID=A0A177BAC6_9BILA|nr:hypothetical protein A3Q56_01115 [Intoshia linei]